MGLASCLSRSQAELQRRVADALATRARTTSLLKDPLNFLPAFDHALKEVVVSVHDPIKNLNVQESVFYVALRGSFGDHHVNPRTLRAAMLGKLISIEGIVTRCTSSSSPSALPVYSS